MYMFTWNLLPKDSIHLEGQEAPAKFKASGEQIGRGDQSQGA